MNGRQGTVGLPDCSDSVSMPQQPGSPVTGISSPKSNDAASVLPNNRPNHHFVPAVENAQLIVKALLLQQAQPLARVFRIMFVHLHCHLYFLCLYQEKQINLTESVSNAFLHDLP